MLSVILLKIFMKNLLAVDGIEFDLVSRSSYPLYHFSYCKYLYVIFMGYVDQYQQSTKYVMLPLRNVTITSFGHLCILNNVLK